jgi:biotin carboxyl carrier protein
MLSPRRVNAALKKELARNGVRPAFSAAPPLASRLREYRKIPSKRLKVQLGVDHFDRPAPLSDLVYEPGAVKIPLSGHIGKPGVPVVEVGRSVEKGALIARIPDNSLGANIHASISGTVVEISDHIVIVSGQRGLQT